MKQIILFILSISIGVIGSLLIRNYCSFHVDIIPFTIFGIALSATILLWGRLKKKTKFNMTYLSICIFAVVAGTGANFLIRSYFELSSNVLELAFQAILTFVCIVIWGRMINRRIQYK